MVDIEKHLVPKIRARFGDRPIEEAQGTRYKAIFRCVHPGFGDIRVSDEREEITVFVGDFTQVHFYDRGWPEPGFQYESEDDYAEKISEEAVEYLEEVFADKYVFWGRAEGIGGSSFPNEQRGFIRRTLFPQKPRYVWSGPVED